jgi:hypothetical protein
VTAIRRVLLNINNGECPYYLSSAYIDIENDEANFVSIILVKDPSSRVPLTAEAQLFEHMCTGIFGMSEPLASIYLGQYCDSLEEAIPSLIGHTYAQNMLLIYDDIDYLESLYRVWVMDVPWCDCFIYEGENQNSSNWHGWPWEAENTAPRSVLRGVDANIFTVTVTNSPPQMSSCKIIRSYSDSLTKSLDVDAYVASALYWRQYLGTFGVCGSFVDNHILPLHILANGNHYQNHLIDEETKEEVVEEDSMIE